MTLPPPLRSVEERNRLVMENMDWCEELVKRKWTKKSNPEAEEDALQIALESLIRAGDKWDENLGEFRAYAYGHIRGSVTEFLATFDRPVKVPHRDLPKKKGAITQKIEWDLPIDGLSLQDTICDPDQKTPEEEAEHREQVLVLRGLLCHLTEKEEETIRSLYGIDQSTESTTELAERLDVSKAAISQRHKNALAKLTNYLSEFNIVP